MRKLIKMVSLTVMPLKKSSRSQSKKQSRKKKKRAKKRKLFLKRLHRM